jgi:carboxyl-terminal processing protease
MKEAIDKLAKAKGIVLDLRDNPGGLLANAIEIANMFLDSGNIVSTVDRDGYKSQMKADGKPLCKKPLVILINRGSASASEITSGALRDNNRAKLVGQKSFGKGLVQGINRLEDGSGVNITIARYLTPNDTDINTKGIAPDLAVEITEKDTQQGKGPWWLDPAYPRLQRGPEDLKDMQLKRAVEVIKTAVAGSMPVAIGSP